MTDRGWWYVNFPEAMGAHIDRILSEIGDSYAIYDRKDFCRYVVRQAIANYEKEKSISSITKLAIEKKAGNNQSP